MSSTISTPYYPASNRTYGVFADVDGSRANTATANQRSLLIGQKYAAGSAPTGTPQLVTSAGQAAQLFGAGSMLHEMTVRYRRTDSFGELWAVPLADPAGTAAAGSITFTVTAAGSGLLPLYVGGVSIPVPVLAGDTASAIAARVAAAINANPDSPASAVAVAGAVNLTALHTGLLGNDIDLRLAYLGAAGGEAMPAGVTAALAPMAGGTGVPSLGSALAALADTTFDFIGHPYSDSASLTALDAFLNFSTGRWSWQSMLFGGYFTAARGTPGALATLGQGRNGPNGSCLGVFDTPDPVWLVAAAYAAAAAVSLRNDPNVPLQNLVLDIQAPPRSSAFVRSLRNTMLYDGISTFTVNRAGQVILERSVTFYQINPAGVPDNAYLDVETLYGTALLIRGWRAEMLRLFPRDKLLQDGSAIPAGQSATTAAQIRLATIAWYRGQCEAGNAQDPDGFARATLAQNAGQGLVKALLPFLLPNQLRALVGVVQFSKP